MTEYSKEKFISDDFGTIFICAIRYCIGRQTYMPRMIQRQIRELLPQLDGGTLIVMRNDIKTAGYWGDERIDKPGWMQFLADIEAELESRRHCGNDNDQEVRKNEDFNQKTAG